MSQSPEFRPNQEQLEFLNAVVAQRGLLDWFTDQMEQSFYRKGRKLAVITVEQFGKDDWLGVNAIQAFIERLIVLTDWEFIDELEEHGIEIAAFYYWLFELHQDVLKNLPPSP